METSYQLEMIVHALKGAALGIESASQAETITPEQAYSLLYVLINQLEQTQRKVSQELKVTNQQ